jgi:hypothetical protein
VQSASPLTVLGPRSLQPAAAVEAARRLGEVAAAVRAEATTLLGGAEPRAASALAPSALALSALALRLDDAAFEGAALGGGGGGGGGGGARGGRGGGRGGRGGRDGALEPGELEDARAARRAALGAAPTDAEGLARQLLRLVRRAGVLQHRAALAAAAATTDELPAALPLLSDALKAVEVGNVKPEASGEGVRRGWSLALHASPACKPSPSLLSAGVGGGARPRAAAAAAAARSGRRGGRTTPTPPARPAPRRACRAPA